MMNIEIKSLPASYRDSFLISIYNKKEVYNILIDCGLKETYRKYIKKEVEKTKIIDLLVLTHIDNDHIGEAIELL